jgi:outer membrane protein TolC
MRYLSYFMRLVLTLAFLAAASLRGAELGVPVSTTAPAVQAGPLSLEKAIDRALLHNLGLTVTRLDALRSLDAVEVTESIFDPTFAWSNRINGSRSVAELTGGLAAPRWHDSDVELSQKFTWGGTLSVGTGLTRTWKESGSLATASAYELGTNVAYTQPLLAGGWSAVNLSALISSRQAAYRNRLALRAASLDLIRDAEVAYWSLAGARTLVFLRETSLRSAESLLAQIRAKRSLGDATVLEELQAEADVSSQRVSVLNSRQSLDSAEMNLRRLLGQGDAAAVEQALLVDQMPTAAVPAPQTFSSWIRTVADFDFSTAIQLSNIVQAEASVAQAEQNDHPSLNLSVGSSRYGNGAAGGGVSGGYDSYRQQSGWNNYAELRLSFPLGFRESEANLRSAYRARRQAELRLADARQNLVFGARASWRELEAARARVDAATSSLDLQRKSYEGERARYDAGQSDVLRVLQAQAALDSAQLNWVQSHLDARAASAKVARLDGSILTRHGFTMDAVEQKIGAGLGSEDPLPPLTVTP